MVMEIVSSIFLLLGAVIAGFMSYILYKVIGYVLWKYPINLFPKYSRKTSQEKEGLKAFKSVD